MTLSASQFLQGKGYTCLRREKGSGCPTQVTPKDDAIFPRLFWHQPTQNIRAGFREWCGYVTEKEKVTEPLGQSTLGRMCEEELLVETDLALAVELHNAVGSGGMSYLSLMSRGKKGWDE